MLDSLISAAPVARQGRIHLLGVSSKTRNPAAPELPTLAEQGLPDMEAVTWNALFVPAQTPQNVVDKLNTALNKAMQDKAILARLAKGASESLAPSTPAQADAYAREQRERWVPFIRAMQIDSN
jgi:tripartite-type tricarboxylate transporter receptor subunit TctC